MTFYNAPGSPPLASSFGAQARQPRNRSVRIGCSVGILVLLAILAIPALLVFVPGWHVRLAGVTAQGTAHLAGDCAPTDVNDTTPTYRVIIQFSDAQGRQQRDESHWACNNLYDEGEHVSLWYLPDDPGSFLTGGEFVWLAVFSAAWVLITIPLALVVVVMMGRLLLGR
jgi:hypothetical protein